ncbi:MAG TPA: hypothetical protein PKZ32_10145 [Candidatus Melainabacteria bacterium]|nr:hypothetical protein [Candidatus Melainabacteria bacterium]
MPRLSISLLALLILELNTSASAIATTKPLTARSAKDSGKTFALNYQRWGDFGSYHLGMKLTMRKDGIPCAYWYINGGWDTTLAHDTLLVYQIPALFPVYLRAYIHPEHPTSPLFNIRKWEDFGPTQVVSRETAVRLVTRSHKGMTNINRGNLLYSPIVKPFKLGRTGFWTSNSYGINN